MTFLPCSPCPTGANELTTPSLALTPLRLPVLPSSTSPVALTLSANSPQLPSALKTAASDLRNGLCPKRDPVFPSSHSHSHKSPHKPQTHRAGRPVTPVLPIHRSSGWRQQQQQQHRCKELPRSLAAVLPVYFRDMRQTDSRHLGEDAGASTPVQACGK